jgi:hypothetical protein
LKLNIHRIGGRILTIKIQEVLGRANHLLSLDTTCTAWKRKNLGANTQVISEASFYFKESWPKSSGGIFFVYIFATQHEEKTTEEINVCLHQTVSKM